jgi:hypothetical protein
MKLLLTSSSSLSLSTSSVNKLLPEALIVASPSRAATASSEYV